MISLVTIREDKTWKFPFMLKTILFIAGLVVSIGVINVFMYSYISEAEWNFEKKKFNDTKGQSFGHVNLYKAGNESDICFISKAMPRIETKSTRNLSFPHATFILCNNDSNKKREKQEVAESGFVFKAARTGSTFLEEVLKNSLKDASIVWEPFAFQNCSLESMKAEFQEKKLNKFLTHTCNLGKVKHMSNEKRLDMKCNGEYNCTSVKPSLAMVFANPYFFNSDIRWSQIFQNASSPRLFILRRTNLVLMGYSKFHHGNGCTRTRNSANKAKRNFTTDNLLQCAHFTLTEQEMSSSRALHAAQEILEKPYLILYEDELSTGSIVQNGLMKHLGKNISQFQNKNIFKGDDTVRNDVGVKKRHVKTFCDNKNVNCTSLEIGLKNYPCLLNQLQQERKGLAWSVPILHNGTISIHGNCYPLPFLNETKNDERTVEDLYQIYPLRR